MKKLLLVLFIGVCLISIAFSVSLKQDTFKLEEIVEDVVFNVNLSEDCNCVNYSRYYMEYFIKHYPELDVRQIRYVDVCNNYTICDYAHTYVIVNGYLGECIIDQNKYACIKIRDIEERN